MHKVTGGSLPASLWHGYMIEALKGVPDYALPTTFQVEENGLMLGVWYRF